MRKFSHPARGEEEKSAAEEEEEEEEEASCPPEHNASPERNPPDPGDTTHTTAPPVPTVSGRDPSRLLEPPGGVNYEESPRGLLACGRLCGGGGTVCGRDITEQRQLNGMYMYHIRSRFSR